MRIFPRGAEWRKWDLHVHAPGTKLNDGYGTPPPWDRYCEVVEKADVAVVGITDYFSLDSFFQFRAEHQKRWPDSDKVFFPNLELRLNESVNTANDIVHIHLLFRPDLDKATADSFLSKLAVQHTEGSGRNPTCAELQTDADFASVTVSRQDIQKAIQATFGNEPYASDKVLLFVPANNDGIRAADSQLRKRRLADEIERQCHALFGHSGNRDYFLTPDRYDDKTISAPPKPVFGGSDAHSLSDLEEWLGKTVETSAQHKSVTWVKADPTFEGLQQTLAEPRERMRIQPMRPDAKEPYKIITAVRFTGTDDFPTEIVFNQNLVSIIGSRSSGKSALLAYIAHAVDPGETEKQQLAVEPHRKPDKLGPAAAITWDAVKDIQCTVEWGASTEHTGHIIYIPQNSLHAISQRPDEITAKIEPTIFRLDPTFEVAYRKASLEVDGANETIRTATQAWFRLSGTLSVAQQELRDVGDKAAVEETKVNLAVQIETLREASSLTPTEIANYQTVFDRLAAIEARIKAIDDDTSLLAPYLAGKQGSYAISESVRLDVKPSPDLAGLPSDLESAIRALLESAMTELRGQIEKTLVTHQQQLDSEREQLTAEDKKSRSDNAELIKKNAANAEIDTLVKSKQKQDEALEDIIRKEKAIQQIVAEREKQAVQIVNELARRDRALNQLQKAFAASPRELDLMAFGLEQDYGADHLQGLADRFNKHEVGPFVDRTSKQVALSKAHEAPATFLEAILSKEQKVIQGQDAQRLAADVLTATQENRFFAEMEGDRIGGFRESSMTPGKQALFALTLILNESDDAWPLLIDQPEDDLDSRSVYDVLVGYLTERKKERQIIMVSHNANLVIGGDSEQIVVANRHGADRKNADGQQFDYLSGSLEHSQPKAAVELILVS